MGVNVMAGREQAGCWREFLILPVSHHVVAGARAIGQLFAVHSGALFSARGLSHAA